MAAAAAALGTEGSELQARRQLRAARQAACATAQQRQQRAAWRRRPQRARLLQTVAHRQSAVAFRRAARPQPRRPAARRRQPQLRAGAHLQRRLCATVRGALRCFQSQCLASNGTKRANRGSATLSDGAPRQVHGVCRSEWFCFHSQRTGRFWVQRRSDESRSRSAGRAAVRFALAAAAIRGCKGATARVRCGGAAGHVVFELSQSSRTKELNRGLGNLSNPWVTLVIHACVLHERAYVKLPYENTDPGLKHA